MNAPLADFVTHLRMMNSELVRASTLQNRYKFEKARSITKTIMDEVKRT